MKKLFIAALCAVVLSGCATLQRHPVLTTVGAAILAGSAVAIMEAHAGHTSIAPNSRTVNLPPVMSEP